VLYKLKNLNDQKIAWTFYKENLLKIDVSKLSNYFRIDKILEKRTLNGQEEYLVTFQGQIPSFQRWLKKEEIVEK
jgi:hypothetical protein